MGGPIPCAGGSPQRSNQRTITLVLRASPEILVRRTPDVLSSEERPRVSPRRSALLLLFFLFAGTCVFARQDSPSKRTDPRASPPQGTDHSTSGAEDLQKATQNPVANLISVPLQNNTNLGIGPFERRMYSTFSQ